jgi:hypothetical protein
MHASWCIRSTCSTSHVIALTACSCTSATLREHAVKSSTSIMCTRASYTRVKTQRNTAVNTYRFYNRTLFRATRSTLARPPRPVLRECLPALSQILCLHSCTSNSLNTCTSNQNPFSAKKCRECGHDHSADPEDLVSHRVVHVCVKVCYEAELCMHQRCDVKLHRN